MKCTCKLCGEEGQDISRGLYALHSRSRALDEALSSTPHTSTTLAALGAAVQATGEKPTAESTFKSGRDIVVKLMAALDDIAALQRSHRRLQNITFDSSNLVTIPPPQSYTRRKDKRPVLRLDPSALANRPYLAQSDDLKRLLDSIKEREAFQTEVTLPTLMELKQDVLQTIAKHENLALAASALTYERRDMYLEEGKGAHIIDPIAPSYRSFHPLHLAFMFLAALISTITGCGEADTLLIMRHVRQVVQIAMTSVSSKEPSEDTNGDGQNLTAEEEAILRHLPLDSHTAIKHYDLLPPLTIFAACPRCSFLYPPLPPPSDKPFQDRCTFKDLQGHSCDEPLLRSRKVGNRLEWRAIRRYPYRDPGGYIGSLYARPDIEETLDLVTANIKRVSTDIWDSEYLAGIKGPDHLPFFGEPGRLAFALAIDWFNPYTNLEAKKKWSIGAVYLVCLNLPPEARFRLENVCLVGIIPGPKEPSLEKVNHFLQPLVDSFKKMYNPGLWVNHTAKYPCGRLVSAIIGLFVADLLGARHCAGFTFPGHTYFCSYCMLTKQSLDNFDTSTWPPRENHKKHAEAWRDATTAAERDRLTDIWAIRWSPFNDLPCFDPFMSIPMCLVHLWLALCQKHARGAWHMGIGVDAGDGSYDPFYQPPDLMTMAKAEHAMVSKPKSHLSGLTVPTLRELCLRRGIRTGGLVKDRLLEELHEWRISRGILDAKGTLKPGQADIPFSPPTLEELCRSLVFEEDETRVQAAVKYIFEGKKKPKATTTSQRCSAAVLRTLSLRYANDPSGTKLVMAQRLLDLRNDNDVGAPPLHDKYKPPSSTPTPTGSHSVPPANEETDGFPRFVPIMGKALLEAVREDIADLTLPEWYKAPPRNIGDMKNGKLSSKEWRSTFIVAFPITLVRLWGADYSGSPSKGQHEALDNFLHLALAISLSLQTEISSETITLYELHIKAYLEGFKILYPTHSITPYHHISLHVPDFLRSIGPWMLSGSGPFEGYNEACQKIKTNSIFGDLEVTIMREFTASAQFRALASSNMLPAAVAPMGETLVNYLNSSRLGGLARNIADEYADAGRYTTIPSSTPPRPVKLPAVLLQAIQAADPVNPVNASARLVMCEAIARGNMEFSIGKVSSKNSQISYRMEDGRARYGRVLHVIGELQNGPADVIKRSFAVVERYRPLSDVDGPKDPYWTHPILGREGYQICRTVYESFEEGVDTIRAEDIIGHIGTCPLVLPNQEQLQEPSLVTVQLDRAFLTRRATPEFVQKLAAHVNLPKKLLYENMMPAVVHVSNPATYTTRRKRKIETPVTSDDDGESEPERPPSAKRQRQSRVATPSGSSSSSPAP